jgi:hypothetical protein
MRIYPITTTNRIANTNPTIAFKFLFFILLFFVVRTGFEPVTIASLGFPSFAGLYTISDFRPTHSLLYRYCTSVA